MRTYMMFIEYIPTFTFSKTYLVFSGRTSVALQCKSENDQLMDANKKRYFLWCHHLFPGYHCF